MVEDSFIVIIPARYASRRFPGKALAKIAGKPMIQYVYERACQSKARSVHIATDDDRIVAAARDFDAPTVMTAAELSSGTERVFAAAKALKLSDTDLIVNVQGDEPLLPAENIDQVAALMSADADMASLTVPIADETELGNENCVKAVMDKDGRALFFSRAVIPHYRGGKALSHWHRHLGIYAYRMAFLARYVGWPPSLYERIEQLEQLRALCNGATIRLARAGSIPPAGVDNPADIGRIEKLLSS